MPSKLKSKSAATARVGLESDFNFSAWSGVLWGFVCAGIDQAAAALKEQVGAKRWEKGIVKDGAISEGDYFLPFKLVGNPWTNVVDVVVPGKTNLSEELVAAISRKLKTKAIFAVYESTAGVFLYVLYDQGKIVEILNWDGSEVSEVVKNVDAARDGFCFYSSLRSVLSRELTNKTVSKFFDSFLRSHGVFLVLESGSRRNGFVTFQPERLRSSEIERADYIGLLSEGELASVRKRNKADTELATIADKCNHEHFWAFKAREEYKDWKHMRPTRAACAQHEADYKKLLAKAKRIVANGVVPSEKLLNAAARNGNLELLEVLSRAAGNAVIPDSLLNLLKQSRPEEDEDVQRVLKHLEDKGCILTV